MWQSHAHIIMHFNIPRLPTIFERVKRPWAQAVGQSVLNGFKTARLVSHVGSAAVKEGGRHQHDDTAIAHARSLKRAFARATPAVA
jgi:hypothetical protein